MSTKNELFEDFDSYVAVAATVILLLVAHDIVATPTDCISCGLIFELTGLNIKSVF